MSRDHVLIATLSTEAQGVTRMPDWLLAQDEGKVGVN